MVSHIALTMDGNRRWARDRGLPTFLGHREGAKRIDDVAKYCLDHGIGYLTLYAFSIENFKRSVEEKNYLFNLIAELAKKKVAEFLKHGIRIRFIGDRSLFPDQVKKACEMLERETAHLSKLCVNFLFCYGGQQEIVHAVQKCCKQVKDGEKTPEDIDISHFSKQLWSGFLAPPEVIIRTGGAQRLSNCLLFHAAYSELFFTDTYWPDFTDTELDSILEHYRSIKRNFGT